MESENKIEETPNTEAFGLNTAAYGPNTKEQQTNRDAIDRMKICLQCEHFLKMTKQCKKCGCFMVIKTRLPNATCPIGKW